MRTLMLTHTYPTPEASNGVFLAEQFRAFNGLYPQAAVEVMHLCNGSERRTEQVDDVRIFRVGSATSSRFSLAPAHRDALTEVLATGDYDILDCHFLGKWHWREAARLAHHHGVYAIRTLHHLVTWYNPYYTSNRIPRPIREGATALFGTGFDHYVAVSQAAATVARQHVPAQRISVVHAGVDSSSFTEHDALTGPAVRVLTVANLNRLKGHHDNIRGFALAVDRLRGERELTLTIAGDGELRAELEALVDELGLRGQVEFLGRVPSDRVPELMSQADVYSMPSVCEAFGCVYLEAMASGLVSIATQGQGIEDVMKDKVNGLLVEPGHPEAVAEALIKISRDPQWARTLAAAGRATAETYSWQRSAQALHEVFDRVRRTRRPKR